MNPDIEDRKLSWQERLAKRVDRGGPDECWPFLGRPDNKGYGRMMVDGRSRKAHVLAWEELNGPMPPGLVGMHSCDNPPCCNPAHISKGTRGENAQDMWRKGRGRVNLIRPVKLTDAEIVAIRQAYESGEMRQSELARRYGVVSGHMSNIVRYKVRKNTMP